MPFVDRIAKKVSLKEVVVDFRPQPVITKDNVTMQIDSVVFYQVTDPKLYTYGVERPLVAIENLTATTLRNIIGELELDATLTSRDHINSQITSILDQATDRWGIKINRVELKNILPPAEIQDAMEKQMKADVNAVKRCCAPKGKNVPPCWSQKAKSRHRFWVQKRKKKRRFSARKQKKQAMILHADAVREQKIREAQGEAEAIAAVQKALAESIEMLNKADPQQNVLALKSLEAFAKAADGKATKLIIPSEIQSFAGLAASAGETVPGDQTGNSGKLIITIKEKACHTACLFFFAPMGLGGHRMEHENVTRDRGEIGMTFLLVGGDERQVYLAKRLAVSNRVLLYGMGGAGAECSGGEILRFPEAGQLREVEVLVLPVPAIRPDGNIYAPFSQIKLELLPLLQMLPAGVRVLGGKIGPVCAAQIASCGFTYEDVLLREDFAVKNAVPTAEGHHSDFDGRTASDHRRDEDFVWLEAGASPKFCAASCTRWGAAVSVCCRRSEEAAWALADGCEVLEPEALASCVRLADAVINTVPRQTAHRAGAAPDNRYTYRIWRPPRAGCSGRRHPPWECAPSGRSRCRKMRAGACGRNPVRNRLPDPKGVGTSWPVNRRWAFV